MRNRLQALDRIRRVQDQLLQAEQWKLAALAQQDAALSEKQKQIQRFLEDETPLSGLFAATTLRRLRALGEQRIRLFAEQEEQSRRVLHQQQRLKRAERLFKSLELEARNERESRFLAEVIEASVARSPASPR